MNYTHMHLNICPINPDNKPMTLIEHFHFDRIPCITRDLSLSFYFRRCRCLYLDLMPWMTHLFCRYLCSAPKRERMQVVAAVVVIVIIIIFVDHFILFHSGDIVFYIVFACAATQLNPKIDFQSLYAFFYSIIFIRLTT